MENKTQKKETPKQLSNKKKEFKLTLDKLKDNITYNAEGPKQNKLHHPSCYSGVTIGAGYDLKYRTEKEVEKDLKEAGMSQNDINILKKGVKLTNKEADNFVKQNPNFIIDEKVKKQLFCNEYNKKSKITQRIIEKTKEIKWDDIPNDVKEYLVDLTYRGDLIPKIQPKIREAVKDIIENKNTKKFEELNLSLHGKKIPDREKRRDDLTRKIAQNVKNNKKEKEDNYIGIHNNNNDGGNNNNNNGGNNNNNNNNNYNLKYKKNISKQSSLKSNSTNDSLNEIKVKLPNNIKGGIDMEYNYDLLIKNCKNIKFQGILNKSDLMLFRQKNQFKSYKRNVFINLEDVAVILKILYDETITHKNISFSLDPFEPKNPTGAFMRKVFYPDVYEGKKILEGTQIGEDMFIADFLLKQLSLGYKPDNSKFEIPYQLSSHGLKPFNYSNNNINTINRRFSRVWVIIKKMENIIKNNNLFCIDNIQLGVDARQMEISEDGTLKDKKIQDINAQCYIFASKFSELYDIASNIYKCFYRLKEIAGAIAFAKWIYQNKFPLNLNLINKIYESTLIPNYNIKVPSIQHFETHTFTNNISVNIDDYVIQYLKDKGIEINYINIENYKNIIRQNNINCSIKRTTSLKKYINEGVDLWNSLLINGAEKNILNNCFSSFSTIDDESNLNLIHFDNLNNIQIDLSDCDVQFFPFIKKCSKQSIKEIQTDILYSKMYNGNYCNKHNPFKCPICNELIQFNLISIGNEKYHKECLKCFYCGKNFDGQILKSEKGFVHKECINELNNKIKEDNMKKFIDNCPTCELCDNKITSTYLKFKDYCFHNDCYTNVTNFNIPDNKLYIIGEFFENIPKYVYCDRLIQNNCIDSEIGLCFQKLSLYNS